MFRVILKYYYIKYFIKQVSYWAVSNGKSGILVFLLFLNFNTISIMLGTPELKIVIAHLGHPWERDTIVLIRKQPNIYADISALYYRPWQFYNSLRLAKEYGVWDKLLFGTDYPATTVESTIKGLYSICELAKKANLPPIEEKEVESLINIDSLKLLIF